MRVFYNIFCLENQLLDQVHFLLEADPELSIHMSPRSINHEEFRMHSLHKNERFVLDCSLEGTKNKEYFSKLGHVLRGGGFDLVDTKMLQTKESFVAARAKLFSSYKLLGNLYGGERHYFMPGRMSLRDKIKLRFAFHLCDFCLCNDRTLVETVQRLSARKPQYLLYNAVNLGRFQSIPNKRDDVVTIFYNHRIIYPKRPMIFFRAVKLLKDRGLKFRVLITGPARDGTATGEEVVAFINEHNLSSVIEWDPRRVSGPEMDELYARSHINVNTAELIVPSLATLEAMASGAALVIARELDSELYVEEGVNGYIVQPTPEGVAEKLEKLIVNPELIEKMSQASRARAAKFFDMKRWARLYTCVYRHILYHQPLPEPFIHT